MAPDSGKIRILVVDDIPDARENLKKLLAFENDMEVVGTAGTGREALTTAKELRPHIILMDINMPDMDGITATRELRKIVPSSAVIMMSVQGEPEYMRRAVQAGARDFLTKPPPAEELYATIRNTYELVADLQDMTSAVMDIRQDQGKPGSNSLARAGSREVARDTHVVVVYSPQGGVGKTMIATNVATELMKEGSKVLLIDANMQFGDVGIFLNLRSTATILDLISDIDNLDMDLVDSVLVTHDSGLRVLLPPARPEEAEMVDPARVRSMIEKLHGTFDFIIVDCSTKLDGLNLEMFDIAERIILVCTPTLPSVIHTLTVLNLMNELGYPAEKVEFVLNKVTPDLEKAKVTLAVAAIEQKFKRKSLGVIPMDERKILFAVNRGTSVVAKERQLSPAKDMIALAESLQAKLQPELAQEPPPPPQPQRSSFFGLKSSASQPVVKKPTTGRP